jgi:hypothetical protein
MSLCRLTAAAFVCLMTATCAGSEPIVDDAAGVARRIDDFIQQQWQQRQITPAPSCSDRQFVRRAYLDLAGRIPRIDEAERFLRDDRSDKRFHLIQQLTASDEYAEHFADLFDAILMGRGSEGDYGERSKHGWREYLTRVFRDNRSWQEVVREILVARPHQQDQRGSVWFVYERNNKPQEIAEAIAPALFGIRIECAQCHDHPLAGEIEQAHYWGLVAFYNRSQNTTSKHGPRVGESAIGGFSEFADLTGESKPNLLRFFQSKTIDEPRPEKDSKPADDDSLYEPASLEGDPRVPKFSRRAKFAEQVAASHPLVARSMVNRLWAMMMGRGLVHPFDEMDSVHAPSHPELLDWLSQDYQASGFDTRRLVRAMALSRAYQLRSVRPSDVDDPASLAWYLERPLTAEQLSRSIQLAVRGDYRADDRLVGRFRQQLKEVLPDVSVTTIKEALFLTNNAALNQFLQESRQPNHLVPRLLAMESPAERVETLFQTTCGRPPSDSEQQEVLRYVAQHDSPERWQQVVWAIVTSAEFRFNH